jgi:hypothetical protein
VAGKAQADLEAAADEADLTANVVVKTKTVYA